MLNLKPTQKFVRSCRNRNGESRVCTFYSVDVPLQSSVSARLEDGDILESKKGMGCKQHVHVCTLIQSVMLVKGVKNEVMSVAFSQCHRGETSPVSAVGGSVHQDVSDPCIRTAEFNMQTGNIS